MRLCKGNMFENVTSNTAIFATGNSVLDSRKRLVMGAGSAKAMKEFVPSSPVIFGRKVQEFGREYYVVYDYFEINSQRIMLGMFQTKYHWKDLSSLDLIEKSTQVFSIFAGLFPKYTFRLAFPGIANGGLADKRGEILLDLQQRLGDNVEVWER